MPKNAAIQKLLEAERRGDLWSRQVLGYPVWGLERLHRYRTELLDGETGASTALALSKTEQLRRFAAPVWRSLRMLARGEFAPDPRRDVWVLSSASYRRPDAEGRPRCIFAEHLRSELGDRLLFLEHDPVDMNLAPADDLVFIDAPLVLAMGVGQTFGRVVAPAWNATRADADGFEGTPARDLLRAAVYGNAIRKLAREALARRRPRALFVLGAYHLFVPVQLAARELGIPIIELQHGVIHESHPGYVFDPDGVPEHLPDRLVVFGRHFGELLDRESPYWRKRWVVGGHPWLKARVAETPPGATRDAVILFGQNDPPVRRRIAELARSLRAIAPTSWRVVVKPHPRELDAADYYRGERDAGIEIASHREDSYALLQRCRTAVTLYSTIAIEALAYPCVSIVVRSPYWNDDIRALVDQGFLTPADDALGIVRAEERAGDLTARENIAKRLFGIGEGVPSFEGMIEEIRRGTR